jgi:NitT/TauT family transport system substrate-binding protein
MAYRYTRRRVLTGLSFAGVAPLVAVPRALADEAPPETTTVRLEKDPGICRAPQYIAEALLRAEGFTDIRHVERDSSAYINEALARNQADFGTHYNADLLTGIENGAAITILSGVHVGCQELFVRDDIRSIIGLRGSSVAIPVGTSTPQQVLVSAMAARVGLDPGKDIRWVASKPSKLMELFTDGKVDAFVGTPPEAQELRARHIGQVLVNTGLDRPWSQYFCCMFAGNRDYVRNYPVATKRVLRAVLKAADFCAAEPDRAARQLVDGGFTPHYDYALQAMHDVVYDKWREYDAEDTVRFYALLLREAGIIKSSPQTIIADGTDWRFLNELKRELKA